MRRLPASAALLLLPIALPIALASLRGAGPIAAPYDPLALPTKSETPSVSGQAIAARMGAPVLPASYLTELAAFHPRFAKSTPLWYYVLKEAEVFEQGVRLGPVGARMVAEVFVGLLQSDSDSFLNADPAFVPSLGSSPGEFRVTDLLTFAGVGGRRCSVTGFVRHGARPSAVWQGPIGPGRRVHPRPSRLLRDFGYTERRTTPLGPRRSARHG